MGRQWRYQALCNSILHLQDDAVRYLVVYDFKGKSSGELPKMFFRHLSRGIEKGLDINRVQKSVCECDLSGATFLGRILEDFNANFVTYQVIKLLES